MHIWQMAAVAAAALTVLALLLRPARSRPLTITRGVFAEAAVVLALFTLWQLVRMLALHSIVGGLAHGREVWDVERFLHLPDEASFQQLFLGHPSVVRTFNTYYATVHFPAMIACLTWTYFRHRDFYPKLRATMVLLTGSCVLIQLVPVAPPRLLPQYGIVDTALQYGQSVYGGFGAQIADQLSAMPSVHVGWAVLVGLTAIRAGRGKLRWLVLLHPVMTIVVVTATGNHWWLDGVVAIGLLALAVPAVEGLIRLGVPGVRPPRPTPPPERAPGRVPTLTGRTQG